MKYRYYKFTVKDIAQVCGLKEDTVRKHIYREKFDPDDLQSIVDYVVEHTLIDLTKDQ